MLIFLTRPLGRAQIFSNITFGLYFSIWLCFLCGITFPKPGIANATEGQASIFIKMKSNDIEGSREFTKATGIAFLELGLLPSDNRTIYNFINSRNQRSGNLGSLGTDGSSESFFANLTEYSLANGRRTLLVEPSLVLKNKKRYIPSLKIIALPNGEVLANVSSLDIEFSSNLEDFTVAASTLVRHAARQLQENIESPNFLSRMPWFEGERSLDVSIENFDNCSLQYILEIMETEFPGFIELQLIKAPHTDYAKFIYRTSASTQRIVKWLNIFFLENRMLSGENFIILNQSSDIRIINESLKNSPSLCASR